MQLQSLLWMFLSQAAEWGEIKIDKVVQLVYPYTVIQSFLRSSKMRLRVSAVATMAFLACMFACPAGAQQKKVTLTYKAPAAVTGITITGYKIYRGTAAGAEGSVAYGTVVGGSVLSFVDMAVTPGVSYFYTVSATGTCDPSIYDCSQFQTESAKSNEAATGAIPLPAAPALGAPTTATVVVQ